MNFFGNGHVRVLFEHGIFYNFSGYEALDGIREQDCYTEKKATKVHEVVVPAVIFKQIP